MKNCPICGTEIEEEISSCPVCGYAFDEVKAEKVGPRRAKSSNMEQGEEKPEETGLERTELEETEPERTELKEAESEEVEPEKTEPEKNPPRIPTPVLGVAAVICVGTIILSTWMLATKTAERKQADETIVIESVHKKEVSETPAPIPSATPTPEPTVEVTPTETPTPTPTSEPEIVETITVAGNLEAKVTDFLFPYSSERKITWEEMDAMWGGMNRDDKHYNSQLAIDELLFRHGWTFSSAEPGSERQRMLDKFYATDWYLQARDYYPEGMDIYDYMANYLNGIERENIDLICEWQKANNVYY